MFRIWPDCEKRRILAENDFGKLDVQQVKHVSILAAGAKWAKQDVLANNSGENRAVNWWTHPSLSISIIEHFLLNIQVFYP